MRLKWCLFLILVILSSCTNETDTTIGSGPTSEPQLIVRFKFDPNQIRLNSTGQPSAVPLGNAAQTPIFNSISAHYLEFTPNAFTPIGQGAILYHAPETFAGGANAIDFNQAKIVGENEVFLSIPLKSIPSGSYEYVRVSLSYQNYDINIWSGGVNYLGTLASFVGFNTYIGTHTIANHPFVVNDDKLQGYWALGIPVVNYFTSGQAPAGSTTVPNPIQATSPIPQGSCVVTGKFPNNLIISGNETQNIEVLLSLSINNSFEWLEVNSDGKYEPAAGENVVDMGLRGLIPSYSN